MGTQYVWTFENTRIFFILFFFLFALQINELAFEWKRYVNRKLFYFFGAKCSL